MELEVVKGIGPKKVDALKDAGIADAETLAQIDLRKPHEIKGVGQDALKRYKQAARRALDAAGVPYDKASYRSGSPARAGKRARKPTAAGAETPTPATGADGGSKKAKKGLLRRILRK